MDLLKKTIHETSPPPAEKMHGTDKTDRAILIALGTACAIPLSAFTLSEGGRNIANSFCEQIRATFCDRPPYIRSIGDFCSSAQVSGQQLCLTNVPCVETHLGLHPIGHEFISPYPSKVVLEAYLCSRTIDSEGSYSYQFGSTIRDCSFIIKSKISLAPLPFELSADKTHKAVITFVQGQETMNSGDAITIQFLTGPAHGKTASARVDHMHFEY